MSWDQQNRSFEVVRGKFGLPVFRGFRVPASPQSYRHTISTILYKCTLILYYIQYYTVLYANTSLKHTYTHIYI